MSDTIRIESQSRWDALALTQRLAPYHWFLVQPQQDRWWICLQVDHEQTDLSDDLLGRVESWLRERHLPAAVVHASDRDYTIPAG